MHPNNQKNKNRSLISILQVLVISTFSCIIGIFIGSSGIWFIQQRSSIVDNATSTQIESPISLFTSTIQSPGEDGFFLLL